MELSHGFIGKGEYVKDYEEIFVQNSYQSYDWNIVAVLQSGNEFAVYMDSGCSCNLPYEGNWYESLSWTRDLYEIGRQARESIRSMRGLPVGECSEALARVNRRIGELKRKGSK